MTIRTTTDSKVHLHSYKELYLSHFRVNLVIYRKYNVILRGNFVQVNNSFPYTISAAATSTTSRKTIKTKPLRSLYWSIQSVRTTEFNPYKVDYLLDHPYDRHKTFMNMEEHFLYNLNKST